MVRIESSIESSAPQARLWSVLTHHEEMPRWARAVRAVHLDPIGSPDPDGLGAVRHVYAVGPAIVERVVEWQAPNRYVYRLESGAPIRDHRGEVRVEATPTGSRATWTIEFRPVVPLTGWIIKAVLSRAVVDMLRGAARCAESDAD